MALECAGFIESRFERWITTWTVNHNYLFAKDQSECRISFNNTNKKRFLKLIEWELFLSDYKNPLRISKMQPSNEHSMLFTGDSWSALGDFSGLQNGRTLLPSPNQSCLWPMLRSQRLCNCQLRCSLIVFLQKDTFESSKNVSSLWPYIIIILSFINIRLHFANYITQTH